MTVFKTLQSIYSECYTLSDFVIHFIYERSSAQSKVRELMELPIFKMLIVAHPRELPAMPASLIDLPETMSATFAQFCEPHRDMTALWGNIATLVDKFLPTFIHEDEKFSQLDAHSWDTMYRVIGDQWLLFLLNNCPLFLWFPNRCLFQITGLSAVDYSYRNKAKKRKLESDAAGAKKLKTDCGQQASEGSSQDNENRLKVQDTQVTMAWPKFLFSKKFKLTFPGRHIMERLKPATDIQAQCQLINDIFHNSGQPPLKSNSGEAYELNEELVDTLHSSETLNEIMRRFLANHHECDFLRMFRAHCSIADVEAKGVLARCCSTIQVRSFASSMIHRVIPLELFGSKHNKLKFQRFCKVFLEACYLDQLSLAHLLHGFRVEDCGWIPAALTSDQRLVVVALLLKWLFLNYLLPCLNGFFYVTDADGHRKRLFYYAKDVWKRIQVVFMKQLLNEGALREISTKMIERLKKEPAENFCLAVARLLPKKTSLRLVINFKNSTKGNMNVYGRSATYLKMLQYLMQLDATLKGCSMSGHIDFHAKWKRFIRLHRGEGTRTCSAPLYFVKLDIQSCFASMNLDRLEESIAEMDGGRGNFTSLNAHFYFVLQMVRGHLTPLYRSDVLPDTISFYEYLRSPAMADKVVVYLRTLSFTKQEVTEKMMDHLKNTYIKIGSRYYRLMQGVAQGSPLSHCLCDIYYASMERKYLQKFLAEMSPNDILLRFVDDYLYCSPEKAKAVNFSKVMQQGMPDYNCKISSKKTVSTVVVSATENGEATVEKIMNIPYFGVCINTKNLEVTANYTQYAGQSIADSMYLDASLGLEGLKRKLIFLCKIYKKQVLFDLEVSCKETVMKNIYEYALMSAFRMHSLSTKLPKCESPDKCPASYFEVVMACIKQITHALFDLKRKRKIVFPLRAKETRLICLHGFITKLSRHNLKYHQLLKMLGKKNEELVQEIGNKKACYLVRCKGPNFPYAFKQMLD